MTADPNVNAHINAHVNALLNTAYAHKMYLELALGLIQRECYGEARTVLERIRDNVTAQKWLLWLDECAPAPSWIEEHSLTVPTVEPEIIPIKETPKEKSGTLSRDLAYVNQAIEDTHLRSKNNKLLLIAGVLTLPFFGTGAALIGAVAYSFMQNKRNLEMLYHRRRALLDDLEKRTARVM